MKTDIEIARSIELVKIKQVARETGIPVEHISNYGRYIAKVDESQINEEKVQQSNLILVTGSQYDFGLVGQLPLSES